MNHEEQDRLFHKETAKNYDKDVVSYASIYHDLFIKPWLKKLQGLDILDYGCGTGCLVESILPYVSSYTGIDHSKEMLEIAQRRNRSEKLKFLQGNCLDLPFENNFFDAVICQGIFHHLSNIEKGLDEVIKVSKIHSKILISEPIKPTSAILTIKNIFRKKEHSISVEEPLNISQFLELLNSRGLKYKIRYSIWVPLPRIFQLFIAKIWPSKRFLGDMVFIYIEK